jgi:hypothetical protein
MVFKWPDRPTTEEIKGDFDRLQISLCGSFPQSQRENVARLRIQTASNGVNSFAKATSQPGYEAQNDFHPRFGQGRGGLRFLPTLNNAHPSLLPLALEDEGGPIIRGPPLLLLPHRQLGLA